MEEKGSRPSGGPPGKPAGECLYSWKEIAAYLKCSERTVRRWEQTERLPVHRHPHKKKASIYAYRAELDAWWNDGHARLEQQQQAKTVVRRPRLLWLGLTATAVIAGGAIWLWLSNSSHQSASAPLKVIPLTSYAGKEHGPALSPDGTQVAFLWTGETDSQMPDVYVKAIDAPQPLRLTDTPEGYESRPTWSPDGRHIAFMRTDQSGDAIYTIPSLGGMERQLVRLSLGSPGLDWSPDGKYLAFPDRDVPGRPASIHLLSLDTLEKRELTSAPADSRGDLRPAFSPDSSRLAFVRTGSQINSIMLMPVTGGRPEILVSLKDGPVTGVAWSADGRDLIYSAPALEGAANCSLWRVPSGGGTPMRLTSDLENAYTPTISRAGNRLAYARASVDVNIWRLEITGSGKPASSPALFISSTRQDGAPQYSPDGRKIAFQSDRLGSREIWICDSDGSDPMQLTFSNGARAGSPHWSPDGRQVAYNIVAAGTNRRTGVYVISAEGGAPRELALGPYEAAGPPRWSRDGKWVYFGSDRTGRIEIWKVPSSGGQPVQVTHNGGAAALESPDGRYLYYNKPDSAGLWKRPLEAGDEILILDSPDPAYWGSWAIGTEGIYYVDVRVRPCGAIDFYSIATRQVKRLMLLGKEPDSWNGALAVSPDGHWILFPQIDSQTHDLILMENFR